MRRPLKRVDTHVRRAHDGLTERFHAMVGVKKELLPLLFSLVVVVTVHILLDTFLVVLSERNIIRYSSVMASLQGNAESVICLDRRHIHHPYV